MAAAPALSIVVPAFQEEARLPGSLRKIASYLESRTEKLAVEILVVDDGSTDATASTAQEAGRSLSLPLRLIRLEENHGKGFAVRTGALAAKGALVLVTDADLSTPIEEWERLEAAKAPVAIGSRAVDESLVKKSQPFFRVFVGKVFNKLVRALAVGGIGDTQCGFKLFTNEAAREIFSRATIDRFAYDVEALLLARRLGYEIAEVPVLWFNSPESRVSLAGGMQAYLDLFRIRFRVARAMRRGSANRSEMAGGRGAGRARLPDA
ncbi:MAG TPA: dolichyl-phosphate beta-glucosyltransferase [Thermoanaerobaculia bacterium]|nr:dolichyl-phosphate beta-glucosyltransferase [Thermoanaerobaculia bacterium]